MWKVCRRLRGRGLGLVQTLGWRKVVLLLLISISVWLYSNLEEGLPPPSQPSAPPTYLVNTPSCQIQSLHPFDPSTKVEQYFDFPSSKIPTCAKEHWVQLVNGSRLHLIREGENCCWREIKRKTQSLQNYDRDADWGVEYGSTCTPIPAGGTLIPEGVQYLAVECRNEGEVLHFTDFTDFFPLAPSPWNLVKDKATFWAEKKVKAPLPPNVVLIGVDSTSRLHMMRSLPKTKAWLASAGFVEMQGYNKVGDNTFPNMVPVLIGMTENEAINKCWTSRYTGMDACPFIWKSFSDLNYVTAFIEDAPGLATFNYDKTGFVEQPTDYYLRPLMAAEHLAKKRNRLGGSNDCLGGGLTPTRVLMRYINQLVEKVDGVAPLFLVSFFSSATHDFITGLKAYDQEFLDFLSNLVSTLGENSVLLFVSDHGYRFGGFRQTFLGFYEDSLPFFFLRLPPTLAHPHPEWSSALQTNSARLTTPHDLYATFVHLLTEISPRFTPNSSLHGTSLFQVVSSSRHCADVAIPEKLCSCGLSKSELPSSSLTSKLGRLLVSQINAALTSAGLNDTTCIPLTFSKFLYGRQIGGGELWNGFGKLESYNDVLLAIETDPWEGRFEGRIRLFNASGLSELLWGGRKEVLGEVGRINSYAGKSECISDPKMKNYCVCGNIWKEELATAKKVEYE